MSPDRTDTTMSAFYADGKPRTQTSPDGHVNAWAYDASGNPTTVWSPSAAAHAANNPTGAATTSTFTWDNLLASNIQPVAVDGSTARATVYGYRPDGTKTSQQVNLVSASNPGSVIGVGGTQTFAWSANRWPLVDTGRNGEQVQRAYDPAGQLTAATDTSSGTTTSISRLLNTATRTVTTTVVGTAQTTGWAWQADGRPDHMTAGDAGLTGIDSTQSWVYNNARLPVAQTTTGWGGASSWATSYDPDGRPQSRTDPARTISRNSAWDSWRDRARASQGRHRPPSLVLTGSGKWAYLDRLKPRWGR